jgi:hypothetical protein
VHDVRCDLLVSRPLNCIGECGAAPSHQSQRISSAPHRKQNSTILHWLFTVSSLPNRFESLILESLDLMVQALALYSVSRNLCLECCFELHCGPVQLCILDCQVRVASVHFFQLVPQVTQLLDIGLECMHAPDHSSRMLNSISRTALPHLDLCTSSAFQFRVQLCNLSRWCYLDVQLVY